MKKVVFTVEKTNTGYSAYAEDYPVFTVGDTISEIRINSKDAINTWFEFKSLPEVADYQIEIKLDIPQLFEFYKEINAKAISKRIGMNESLLSQYVTGLKKPSPKQRTRILDGIKSLGKELVNLDLD